MVLRLVCYAVVKSASRNADAVSTMSEGSGTLAAMPYTAADFDANRSIVAMSRKNRVSTN